MDPPLFPFPFFWELEQPNITYLVQQQQQDRRKRKIVIRHLPEYFQKRLNKNIKREKFIFLKEIGEQHDLYAGHIPFFFKYLQPQEFGGHNTSERSRPISID